MSPKPATSATNRLDTPAAPEHMPAKRVERPRPLEVPDLIPARMLNEFTYCPRLAYLEWVQGEFAPNYYTEDGKYAHRRVDGQEGTLPFPDDPGGPKVARSVMMSAPREGLVARIDLVETDGDTATPVDYKRGKKPRVPEGAYEPERVQLCVQGLILRENGFRCDGGVLYFVGSKERVEVRFDDALAERARELARELRAVAGSGRIPAPLDDSPKCSGCSLVGICLPDETRILAAGCAGRAGVATGPRRLVPARDDALPLFVQAQGGYLSKSGDRLVVKVKGEKTAEARLFETSQVALFGATQVSTAVIRELCNRGIPMTYFSYGGWFYGMTQGMPHKNVELRIHQYRTADDAVSSLGLARRFVATKIRNCRTLLRRNGGSSCDRALARLKELARAATTTDSLGSLLGVEGTAARVYFEAFPSMLKRKHAANGFSFDGRNRRPPRDPINAMLSFAYALLTKDLTITTTAAGLDPYRGFYHQPRYGRPSLSLDLMEEFRPLIADSTVLAVVNNNIVTDGDFVRAGDGVALRDNARKAFLQAYERRMDQIVRHPVFHYQISYRRVLDVQARLLGRFLTAEIPEYPEFTTR